MFKINKTTCIKTLFNYISNITIFNSFFISMIMHITDFLIFFFVNIGYFIPKISYFFYVKFIYHILSIFFILNLNPVRLPFFAFLVFFFQTSRAKTKNHPKNFGGKFSKIIIKNLCLKSQNKNDNNFSILNLDAGILTGS